MCVELQVRLSVQIFRIAVDEFAMFLSVWVMVLLSIRKDTYVLRIICLAREWLVNLPIIGL